MTATSTVPSSESPRIEALDVLRGIAILGTLASNIWIFAAFIGSSGDPVTPEPITVAAAWLPNGKFLGLLTIMFGIGIEIQRQAARRAGRSWPGTYPIRAGLLFLDGLLNYVFVVQFDVLRAYAVTGLIVAFLLLTSERVQWWVIGIMIPLHLSMLVMKGTVLPSGPTKQTISMPSDGSLSGAQPSSYWDDVVGNLTHIGAGFSFGSEFFTIILMGVGLFLLGANLYRLGIFEPRRRILRRWLMVAGFAIGVPLDAFFAFVAPADSGGALARYGAAPIVAIGILAAVAEFYQQRRPGRIGRNLAAVGKMALSCYLLQNILGVIFQKNSASLPLFAEMDGLLGTLGLFAIISVALVAFARLWSRRFRRGPFELIWDWCYRALTRRRESAAAVRPA